MSVRIPVPDGYIESIASDPSSLPEPVRTALESVRRHRFLDGWFRLEFNELQADYHRVSFNRDNPCPENLALVYSNRALVTAHDGLFPTSSTSQPSLVARMLELLDVSPGMKILEIGTGTGYNAALLAELGGIHSHVYTVELQQDVAERAERFLQEEGYGDVHVVHGDGFLGVEDGSPFDRIVATVGCSDISPHWLEQLSAEGSSMLIPLQHGATDPLVRLTRDPEDPQSALGEVVDRSGFMKIQGALEWGNPWRTCRIRGLPEDPEWCRPFPGNLAVPEESGHPFYEPNHWGFTFFLTICSREIWYDNSGYGLADPGSKSIVKFTKQGIEGVSVGQDAAALERLYERLLSLHQAWTDLGSPSPSDYTLCFTPKNRVGPASLDPLREWCIERPYFLETIRLP
ncbi:protein-L-isoaspartate O-methyltransferase [Candidatus Bipolaricaulota bacterium]